MSRVCLHDLPKDAVTSESRLDPVVFVDRLPSVPIADPQTKIRSTPARAADLGQHAPTDRSPIGTANPRQETNRSFGHRECVADLGPRVVLGASVSDLAGRPILDLASPKLASRCTESSRRPASPVREACQAGNGRFSKPGGRDHQVRLGEPARPEKQADVLTAAHRTGHAATEPVQAEALVVDP